jgi:DNA-binding response OmpR family regulator
MRVLLIEDDAAMSRSIELMLGSEGIAVNTTELGSEGVDLGKIYDYDLILLDLNLPDMSGTDILAKVKGDERLRRAPVVVLTTTDDKVEIQRCYDLGCNVYITKPVDYESFAGAIRQLGLFLSVMQSPDID